MLLRIPSPSLLSAQLMKSYASKSLFRLDWTLTFTTEYGVQYLIPFSILPQANITLCPSSFRFAATLNADPKPFTL